MALLGLKDDYTHSGCVLLEALDNRAVADSLRNSRDAFIELSQVYKQINAPVGELGLLTLGISTKALVSNAPGDSTYTRLENGLAKITDQRDDIASQMSALLEGAAFNGQSFSEAQVRHLIERGEDLLDQVGGMA